MSSIRLNKDGIAVVARSPEMVALVREVAEKIAENVRELGIEVGDRDGGPREQTLPVTVTTKVTDRAHATVTIAHPAGIAVQAKHGALTRAAAAERLTVR